MSKAKQKSVQPVTRPEVTSDTPVGERDQGDPGDITIRKFRYQFGYGTILLIGSTTGKLDYKAIWCEQHEDFLGEIGNDLFDAIQVKTRTTELGVWEINDEAFWKSIKRFVELDRKYKKNFRAFHFVSNAKYSESASRDHEKFSPPKLLHSVSSVRAWNELPEVAKAGFEWLQKQIESTPDELFAVLSRLRLVIGPTELAFEAEIAQCHLPELPACAKLDARTLGKVRDVLIDKVGAASSLSTEDPARHYVALINGARMDPLLAAKCITTEDLKTLIADLIENNFLYLEEFATLEIGKASKKMNVMQQKLTRGGLAHHYEMMRRRALSAEGHLLEIATQSIDRRKMLSQIENTVFGVCDDAYLRASGSPEPFGRVMLIDVQERLKLLTQDDAERVHHQDKELLIGVAGLLTAECRVWWSKPFGMESVQ